MPTRFRLAILGWLCACAMAGAGGNPAVVVMMGDSTTLCAESPAGSRLTDFVSASLASNEAPVRVINAGKGRDTVHGAYPRLPADVLAHQPDLVTLSFGLNDSVYLTPQQYRDGLERLVRTLQTGTTARVILVTSTPFVNERHSLGAKFTDKGGLDEYLDAAICSETRAVAAQFNLPLCDLHAAFKAEFKANPALADAVIRPDGVHLTEEGNRLAARYLVPVIRATLNRQR
jgi:acyl-CoA thioesterase-1